MKLTKKKSVLLGAAFASLFLFAGCGKTNIGYVDGDRLMQEAPQIKSLYDEGNQKIQEAQQQAQQDLESKQGQLSDEEMQKAQQDAQRKVMGISQSYSIQLKQKIDTALESVAKEKKLDAVVENSKAQKIVVEGGTDVTDDAIAKLQ